MSRRTAGYAQPASFHPGFACPRESNCRCRRSAIGLGRHTLQSGFGRAAGEAAERASRASPFHLPSAYAPSEAGKEPRS